MKYPQLALAWVLYGLGHVSWLVLERWIFDERDEDLDDQPVLHSVVWRTYQWCMCSSARLDRWDAIWKSTTGPGDSNG
jgi:hypothetical protein